MSLVFQRNLTYVCITSIIGFANAIFIDGDMGFNIVNDFRKIEFENRE